MKITSRAPVRVDFAGGWTDVNLFARGAGGAVVNAAIDRYVTGELHVHDADASRRLALAAASAAPGYEGIRVSYQCDLPSGTGLGTSAALNVVWLSLVQSQIATEEDRARIAELAYQLEEILGILGGKQDQYAAAFGGINYMAFDDGVRVERLQPPPELVTELHQRLVLCYTGKQRLSGNIHENVWGAFRRGEPATVNALYSLRSCAQRMRDVLASGTVDAFADLLSENWRHQKALDPSVTNAQIEALFEAAWAAGAVGGKACGAGGGGCLLFCAERGRVEELSGTLSRSGARVIPFQFDTAGLQVSCEAEA